jgi:hypothetical protein
MSTPVVIPPRHDLRPALKAAELMLRHFGELLSAARSPRYRGYGARMLAQADRARDAVAAASAAFDAKGSA